MEEEKRNNILDNLEENEKALYEILGIIGEIKSRVNGSIPLCQKKTECNVVTEQCTVNGKVGKQTEILVDILEEVKALYELI